MSDTVTPVLHIEDDQDDALLIGRALQRAGLDHIQVMKNGEEAVSYLRGDGPYGDRGAHPLPSLILLDLNIPLMTGHEFLAWLRDQAQLRRIPVIVLSSSNAETDIAAAYEAGANAYLVKTLDYREMTTMLRDTTSFWLGWNRLLPSAAGAAG